MVKLYLDDYAKAWDDLLQDIEIVPLRSLPQAAQDLYILASPQSPMKELLTAIARQLTLSEPPKSAAAKTAAEAAAKKAAAKTAAAAIAQSTTAPLILVAAFGQPGAERRLCRRATRSTNATSRCAIWSRQPAAHRSTRC